MSILFWVLLVLTVLLWIGLAAGSLSLHASDPAGNALAQSFAALGGIALWLLLALLLLAAAGVGAMPLAGAVLSFLLVPASGFAVQAALAALGKDRRLKWPAVVPAAIPGLLIAYSLWCALPALRSLLGPTAATAGAFGPVLVLSALAWAARLGHARARAAAPGKSAEEAAADAAREEEERRRRSEEAFRSLTPDSPLWEWWTYTEPGSELRGQALEGARRVKSRQADVAKMLGQGKRSVFLAVPALDLEATEEIEQAIRAFLQDQVKRLMPYDPAKPMPTSVVTEWFEAYFPTIRWLVERHRSCDAELAAIAAAAGKYPDCPEGQAFLAELRRLVTTPS